MDRNEKPFWLKHQIPGSQERCAVELMSMYFPMAARLSMLTGRWNPGDLPQKLHHWQCETCGAVLGEIAPRGQNHFIDCPLMLAALKVIDSAPARDQALADLQKERYARKLARIGGPAVVIADA